MMKFKNFYSLIFLFIMAFVVKVNAQSFTASVNSTTVNQHEPFQVSFEFNGSDINSLHNFKAPDFKGLLVLSGPNQASSMQIINGAVSASITYSYYLQAEQTGIFTIGPASTDYKGKTFKTQPIKITVAKSSANTTAKKDQDNSSAPTQNIADNVFIRAIADKQKVLKGEQVTITYKLYTRLNISAPQVSKLPVYQGFWAEELDMPATINLTTEVFEGKQYRVGVLKKVALFPTQSGELSVTPFELVIPVAVPKQRKRTGDIFDEFFNDPFFGQAQTVDYKAKSNTLKIQVEPLPSGNVPPSFKGAVGNYSFNASIDKNTVKANEPVNLKFSINGTGNIKLLELPEIKFPAGFETYDPKISDQVNRGGKISGQKSFEYPIVPRITGQKEIPPFEFSYFDPSSRRYITLKSPSFKLDIKQGDANYNQSAAGFNKEDVKLLGQDIRYIKTSTGGLSRIGNYAVYSVWFWVVSLLPLFAVTGLVVWKKQNDKLAGNVQLLRYQKAQKLARNQLKAAKISLDANKHTEFYTGVSQALFGYLESKLHIPKSEFSVERAEIELNKKNIPAGIIDDVKKSVEQCEFARFAPQTDGSVAMQEMYNKAVSIIVELEKNLVNKKSKFI